MTPRFRYPRSILALRCCSAGALLLCLLSASMSACSSDSEHPDLVASGGNAGRSGSSSAEAGSTDPGGASGDQTGDSGAPGYGHDGGGTSTELGGSGGKPEVVPAACDKLAAWSKAMSVPGISSSAEETLLALTPDELDLAFLRGGALYVAHRTTESANFSSGPALAIPTGWSAAHGASLSADGKRLLLVADPDRKKLGEWTRPSRTSVFSGPIDTSAFAAINQDSDFTGKVYASPIIAATDDQLIFNSSFVDADSTIVVSTRTGAGTWSTPRALSTGIFDGGAGKRRLPTGMSADGRTLFYFNEESAEQEARWRATSSPNSALYDMRSLGARRGATPNSACNRLYSQSNGDVVAEND